MVLRCRFFLHILCFFCCSQNVLTQTDPEDLFPTPISHKISIVFQAKPHLSSIFWMLQSRKQVNQISSACRIQEIVLRDIFSILTNSKTKLENHRFGWQLSWKWYWLSFKQTWKFQFDFFSPLKLIKKKLFRFIPLRNALLIYFTNRIHFDNVIKSHRCLHMIFLIWSRFNDKFYRWSAKMLRQIIRKSSTSTTSSKYVNDSK